MKRLKSKDWYDVADLFGSAADCAEDCGDGGLNTKLAHEKASKMMRDMAQKAHNRAADMEEKEKSRIQS